MGQGKDARNARRIEVCLPVTFIVLRGRADRRPGIEHIQPSTADAGTTRHAQLLDISINGAFIACRPPPLLSRLMMQFTLPGYGPVTGVGWSVWRRTADDLSNTRPSQTAGVGVLFEHLPLTARFAIQELAAQVDALAVGAHG